MALDIRIHHDLHEAGLESRWSALHEAMPDASIFNTWQWCASWAYTLGSDTLPVVIEICEAGCTIGLAPLGLRATRAGRWLELLGRRRVAGDHLDILALPERRRDVVEAMLKALDERLIEFDGVELGDVERDSPTLGMVGQWCGARKYSMVHREHRVVPYVSLPRSFEDYLADRSPNMRYHIRRRRRSAAKAGRHIELIRSQCDVDRALDAYFELHHRQWNSKQASGNFQDAGMAGFLREFCHLAAGQDWLRCYCLMARDRIEGVLIAFQYRGTASYYQIGWDPQLRSVSPGVLLLAASIEQAILERLAVYDFLQGDEDYKKRWTNQTAEQVTMLIGCRGAARIAVVAERMKQALKISASRLVRTATVGERPDQGGAPVDADEVQVAPVSSFRS